MRAGARQADLTGVLPASFLGPAFYCTASAVVAAAVVGPSPLVASHVQPLRPVQPNGPAPQGAVASGGGGGTSGPHLPTERARHGLAMTDSLASSTHALRYLGDFGRIVALALDKLHEPREILTRDGRRARHDPDVVALLARDDGLLVVR